MKVIHASRLIKPARRRHYIGAVFNKTERKSTKSHDFSDLNLNYLGLVF